MQIASKPHVLLIAAMLALALGAIPGFPFTWFLVLGLCCAAAALAILFGMRQHAQTPPPLDFYLFEPERQARELSGQAVPLSLEVSPELYFAFQKDPRWNDCFGALYQQVRWHLTQSLGVLFPEIKLLRNLNWRGTHRYRIRIYDIPVASGEARPDRCAAFGRKPIPLETDVEAPEAGSTAHGTPLQLYRLQDQPILAKHGVKAYGPEEMLLRHLAKVLQDHAGDFLGIQEVHQMLRELERHYPELVREVVPKRIPISKFAEILRRLVEEGVPIKDLRLILQTLSSPSIEDKDPVALTEEVRIGLKRSLTFRHARDGKSLEVLTLSLELESEIRGAIRKNGSECYLVLPPPRLQELSRVIQSQVTRFARRTAVILTACDIRRYVRKLIEPSLPEQAVLCFQELDSHIVLKHLACLNAEEPTVISTAN